MPPRKKPGKEPSAGLNHLMEEVRKDSGLVESTEDGIVDIITFCDGVDYLNLPGSNFNLFLGQRVILKSFYMGTMGNESVELSEQEWTWLYERSLDNVITRIKKKIDGINNGERHRFNFHELHLALGRRASKTILASIIVAYEAYKLIKLGDPYAYYHIPEDEEIAIINVSNSQNQSSRLFSQIKARIRNSPFFRGRVDGDATATMIRLYTDVDLRKKGDKGTNISVEGSVVLICGHSNPDTLRGYSAATIIFDELAYYDENPKVSGRAFYNALTPSIGKFYEHGDGRLVEISSVAGMSGIFYEIWKHGQSDADEFRGVLSYRLATWDINDDLPYEGEFLTMERAKDPDAFAVEYGSMWSTRGLVKKYFSQTLVDSAFKPFMHPQTVPDRKMEYFAHVDPAATKDNYAMAIVYRTKYINVMGEKRWRVGLAFHTLWKPQHNGMLDFKAIDTQVVHICRRFNVVSISYDTWNSVHSMNHMKSKGIHCVRLQFSRGNKALFYQHLEDLMGRDELWLYHDEMLYGEMTNIKYKPSMRGISIDKDEKSDFPTDDLVDCIAGATWRATGHEIRHGLPATMVANMGRNG